MKLKVNRNAEIHMGNVAQGFIYGDERGKFPDGTFVRTSTVIAVSEDGNEIKTRNSTYEIERISIEEWQANFIADLEKQ